MNPWFDEEPYPGPDSDFTFIQAGQHFRYMETVTHRYIQEHRNDFDTGLPGWMFQTTRGMRRYIREGVPVGVATKVKSFDDKFQHVIRFEINCVATEDLYVPSDGLQLEAAPPVL